MNASKAMDWIRLLFAQIDKGVYWLITTAYSIIIELSEISIFGNSDIQTFAKRIYVFLGIIMLFKVTFSLITYLIDPDSMSDKTKGIGNIAKNIVITLFLIILVPYGFDFLYRAQSAIIKDNLLPRLILGTTDTETTNLTVSMNSEVCGETVTEASNYGEYLSLISLRPFLQIYEDSDNVLSNSLTDIEKNLYCKSELKQKLNRQVILADTLTANIGQYIFDYSFVLSTAFGVIILLLLLNFCFDIAVRTIKLGFLEIIAPIPIISYIDPKSGKDGIFTKWYREVFSTWASLFIKLATIYFAIYIIQLINSNVEAIQEDNSMLIMLFLVIGALMFAKQASGLIENIFGVKFSHTVQLNPFKKISDQAMFGKQALGFGAASAAAVTAGAANFGTRLFDKNTWKDREGNLNAGSIFKGVGMLAGSTIAGAASGGYRAFSHTNKDGNIFKGIKMGHLEAMFAKQQREDLSRKGSTAIGRMKADAARTLGVFNTAQQNIIDFGMREHEINQVEQSVNLEEQLLKEKKSADSDGYKEYADIIKSMSERIDSQTIVKDAKDAIESLKNSGGYYDRHGNKKAEAINLERLLKEARQKVYNGYTDPTTGQAYAGLKTSVDMIEKQKRLEYLVDNVDNLKNNGYEKDVFDANGNLKKAGMFNAQNALSAIETSYVQEFADIETKRAEIARDKAALARDKEAYSVKAAEADNAARGVTGPQPEGWGPSPDMRYGPGGPYSGGPYGPYGGGPGGGPGGPYGPYGGGPGGPFWP